MSRLRKPSKRILAALRTALHQDWRNKRTKAQSGLCFYCQKPMTQPTLDHVIPLSKGGADHWENTVAACFVCNQAKADQNLYEFAGIE